MTLTRDSFVFEDFFIGLAAGMIIMFLCMSAAASAMAVNDYTITPNTTTMIGQPVSASFSIDLTPYNTYTTNPNNQIILSTSLDNPEWTESITLDSIPGQAVPKLGKSITLPGWQLVYPLGTDEKVSITVNGNSPNVTASQNIGVVTIYELDNSGKKIAGSESEFSTLVINGADISYIAKRESQDLATLKGMIESPASNLPTGTVVDRSAAQALYKSASNGIDYLNTLKPEEYEKAVGRAQEIDRQIKNAGDMINRENVQAQINYAARPLNQTAMILSWFAGNESTAKYTGVQNISQSYNNSLNLLSVSEQAMNAKDWPSASTNATRAFAAANQTLYDAKALQNRASDPISPFWDNFWYLVGVIVVGGGYLLFRPNKKKVKKE